MPAATTKAKEAKVKVLVESLYSEVTARTGVDYVPDSEAPDGYREVAIFRRFHDKKCYMTPQEAAFLVDSVENQRRIDHGLQPLYKYPAGSPFPVPLETGGEMLSAPLTEEALATTDSRQADAARVHEENRRRIIEEKNANARGTTTSRAASGKDTATLMSEATSTTTPE